MKQPRIRVINHYGAKDEASREGASTLIMPWEQKQVVNDALTHLRKLANIVPTNVSTANQVETVQRALMALRAEVDTVLKLLKQKPEAQDPEDKGKKPPALDRKRARDARLTPEEERRDQKLVGEARATGRHLADDLTTTSAVRSFCRSKGMSRIQEAYVVEGFKGERMRQGLSENV